MNKPDKVNDFLVVRTLAEAALENAKTHQDRFETQIDWNHLAVTLVRRWEDETGEHGYELLIQQASDVAWDLQEFIEERMAEAGISANVVTEW